MNDIKNFMALDLELNQPTDSIIQIGAVVGEIKTGKVLSTLSRLVKIDETLCTDPSICDIPKLTGITDEMLINKGTTLFNAYKDLEKMHKEYNCFRNPLVWGGGDSRTLREQLHTTSGKDFSGGFGVDKHLPMYVFGHRWIDVKTIFQMKMMMRGRKVQSGLAKALIRMNMKFEGRKHDAMYDALNTFKLAHVLFKVFEEKEEVPPQSFLSKLKFW